MTTSVRSKITFWNQTPHTDISQVSQHYGIGWNCICFNQVSGSYISLLRWPIGMLDMWNLTADCMLLILHLEISLTNLEPLQPYFICLNCICSVITITITIIITIITLTTISTAEALITCYFRHLHHRHHPGHHNLLIRYTKPYRNLLLHCFCSLQGRPLSNFSRSTLIHSQVGSVASARRVHQDLARRLGYVHCWHSIRCSTPPPPPPPPPPPAGLTRFDRLQINSDWLTGRRSRFGSSSTLSQCKDAGLRPSLTFDSLFFLLFLFLLLIFLLPLVWPVSNFCRSALIDSLVCSIDSSLRVHQDLARTLGYVHYRLSIRCSTPPPPPPPPPPAGLTPFDLLQINSDWLTGRLSRFGSSSTLSWYKNAGVCSSLTFDSLFFLLLLFLLPQVWPISNFCRSALIDLLVCSIDSSRRAHQELARTLGYVHYWLSIRCSTPPPPAPPAPPAPPPAGLTPFDHLQINSDWLTSRRHRFGWSSTLRWCNDTGVYPILTGQWERTEIQK